MKMNPGNTPINKVNEGTSHAWAIWSVALGGVAVMANGWVLVERYWVAWDGPSWLSLVVLGPIFGAFWFGLQALFIPCHPQHRVRIRTIAALGCSMALMCAIVATHSGTWRQLPKSSGRACIANMRNIDSALQQAMMDEPGIASLWTNSAQITERYLKNPATVCCPRMSGVPYLVNPRGFNSNDNDCVRCPFRQKYPHRYSGSHDL